MNQITVVREQDGTETWSNTADDTGEVIRYLFAPVASLQPGDRIEGMQQFERGPDGKLRRGNASSVVVLTPPIIATFPVGSFVRLREKPGTAGQGARILDGGR